jgi:hypothetical protein
VIIGNGNDARSGQPSKVRGRLRPVVNVEVLDLTDQAARDTPLRVIQQYGRQSVKLSTMRLPVVGLIDLGFDDDFGKAMTFAQSLLSSINVSGHRAEVEYIRTTDLPLVARSLTVPVRMIHVMSHGLTTVDDGAGFGCVTDEGDVATLLSLSDLAGFLQAHGEGIEATAVFADSCGSAQEGVQVRPTKLVGERDRLRRREPHGRLA